MTDTEQIAQIVTASQKILVIQADNPDADSLASALALEQIFHDLGKEPYLYCGIDMPEYLRYLSGWDRVEKDIPSQFDSVFIVDTSSISLLEKLAGSGSQGWVAAKPVVVLDHHADVTDPIPYAAVSLNDPSKVSTGQLIYGIAKSLDWPLTTSSAGFIMTSILGDSMGLTTENTTAETYRIMAELIDLGVNRPELEELRRKYNKMQPEILRYKGRLIERSELLNDGTTAIVVIPQDEINNYSPLYNPGALIQGDLLQTAGVLITIVLKSYDSGRVTAAIRCNQGAPIASKVAEHFGGGGHAYAAGFKLEGKPLNEVKSECTRLAGELLASNNQE